MQHVTRNLLLLAVIGITLIGTASVDARQRNRNYTVDVNRSSIYPGHSSYKIDIRDNTIYPPDVSDSNFRRSRYRSYNPNMIYVGDYAIPSVSRILNNVSQKHRERRRLKAETELLEAQTALLRRQLQQIEDAERYKRNQQLVYGNRTKRKAPQSPKPKFSLGSASSASGTDLVHELFNDINKVVTGVRSGAVTPERAITLFERKHGPAPQIRGILIDAGLLKKPASQTNGTRYIRLPSGRPVAVGK